MVSLLFNVFTWRLLGDMKAQLWDYARQSDVQRLSGEIGSVRSTIGQMAEEAKWIRSGNFYVNEGASRADRVVLRGEWTLRELGKGQTPSLLLREQGSPQWQRIALTGNGGLTFSGEMALSPDKRYEYQVAAAGESARAGDVTALPYEQYGRPQWRVEMGGSGPADKGKVSQNFRIYFDSAPPLAALLPERAYLEVNRGGQVEQLPFTVNTAYPYKEFAVLSFEVDPREAQNWVAEAVVVFADGVAQRQRLGRPGLPQAAGDARQMTVESSSRQVTVEIKTGE
jgi:hypothetical protein